MKTELKKCINDLEDQIQQYRNFADRKREPGYELNPCIEENHLFAARKLEEVKNKLEIIVNESTC